MFKKNCFHPTQIFVHTIINNDKLKHKIRQMQKKDQIFKYSALHDYFFCNFFEERKTPNSIFVLN